MTVAPWSLRRRLVLGIVALLAVVSAVVGAISVLALRENLMERLDAQVRTSLDVARGGGGVPSAGQGPLDDDSPQQRLGSLLLLTQGRTVLIGEYLTESGDAATLTVDQAQELVAAVSSVAAGQPVTVDLGGDLGAFRVAAVSASDRVLVTGLSMSEVDDTTRNLALIFALVALAALTVAAVAGAVVVRLALRPLGRVAATATRVAELPLDAGEVSLEARVPEADTDPRTEVGQVGAALNRLLGHVESALQARQASEDTLRRFVADASHELRTPLASIRGYSELAQRVDGPLPPDVARSLDRIGSESVRMTTLVEDLLLLARLDAGGELRREPVHLAGLLVDAVSDAHVAGPEHVWELDLADDAGEIEVQGDPHRLQQVLVNLLANARTHTPAGTTVTAGLAAIDTAAVLTVVDDGPGIPPELQPRLFERFVRGDDSRSRAAGSSGLGLSIVAAIVEAHAGEVTASSEPGRTVVTVRLPFRPPAGPRD